MAGVSDLIRAVAELIRALQWPLVAWIIAYFFREPIKHLLGRITHGEFWGAKAEFLVDKLEESTQRSEAGAILEGVSGEKGAAIATLTESVSTEDETGIAEREELPFRGQWALPWTHTSMERDLARSLLDLANRIEVALEAYVTKLDPTFEKDEEYRRVARTPMGMEGSRSIVLFVRDGYRFALAKKLQKASGFALYLLGQNLRDFWRVVQLVERGELVDAGALSRAIESGLSILERLLTLPLPDSPDHSVDTAPEADEDHP